MLDRASPAALAQHKQWIAARARIEAPREISARSEPRGLQLSAQAIFWLYGIGPAKARRLTKTVPDANAHVGAYLRHQLAIERGIQYANAPTMDQIKRVVAELMKVPFLEFKSSSRKARPVEARQIAIYLSRKLTGNSFPVIGRAFGGRDHTTVLHACKKIDGLVSRGDERICEIVAVAESRLLQGAGPADPLGTS